jgi:hypothetical protein
VVTELVRQDGLRRDVAEPDLGEPVQYAVAERDPFRRPAVAGDVLARYGVGVEGEQRQVAVPEGRLLSSLATKSAETGDGAAGST